MKVNKNQQQKKRMRLVRIYIGVFVVIMSLFNILAVQAESESRSLDESSSATEDFVPDPVVFVDETHTDSENESTKVEEITLTPKEQALQKKLEEEEAKKKKMANELVEEFSSLKMTERDILQQIDDNQAMYNSLRDRLSSLYSQVKELDRSIIKTERNIDELEHEIDDLRDEIRSLKDDVQEKESEIATQEIAIKQYINAMYMQSNKGSLDMLLAGETFGDLVQEVEVMDVMEEQGELLFARLQQLKNQLEDEIEDLEKKQEELKEKKEDKRDQVELLREQRDSKEELIKITKGKQEQYLELIEEAKQEQEDINDDLEHIKDKLELLDSEQRANSIELNYLTFGDKLGQISENGLTWPVDPARGITAFFKDPSYKSTMGVEHYAIDVRASMQTPIMAAADGYVYKAKDAGYGYSYLVIIHNKEVATVYGHIYEFAVEEGDFVESGQIIGYSGGMPGTKGAGLLTTGPHLHFEVRLNGKAVDPLTYLP